MVGSGRGAVQDNMSDIRTMSELKKKASNAFTADALVVFGATGNLAYKKNFPSLQLW
jgi:glucose-6-phosphate 1-dehydrogenase